MSDIQRNEDGTFKEGQSANPGAQFSTENQPDNRGRKGKSVTDWLNEYGQAKELEFKVTITKPNGEKKKQSGKVESVTTINQLIATTIINKAVQGDDKAIDTFLDRTEGKPKQSMDMEFPQLPEMTLEERKQRVKALLKKANESDR